MTRSHANHGLLSPPRAFQHVLVATDFSAGASRALARAALLPLADGARISVVFVRKESAWGAPTNQPAVAAALDKAVHALRDAAKVRRLKRVTVEAHCLEGNPHQKIVEHARAIGADLIVVGRHGERPLRDMFIGSTASRVVRLSDVPVLVVTKRAKRDYRRAVVAVDLEDTSRRVIDVGLQAQGSGGVEMTLVHAFTVPFEGFITPGVGTNDVTALRASHAKAAAAGVEVLRAGVAQQGVACRGMVLRGDARLGVLEVATRRRADLVVVGTHRRSAVGHAMLGSVAEWIMQSASCDVLVAPPLRLATEKKSGGPISQRVA